MSYTAVPNWLIDQAATLPAAAFKVAIVICRLTIGWQKDADEISLGRLRDLTKLSKPTLINALRDLADAGIIEGAGSGRWGMGVYKLVKEFDRSSFFTGQVSLPDCIGSVDEPVKKLDQIDGDPVKKLYTQKKEIITTTSVVVVAANSEPDEPNRTENEQLTLAGCPEPPTPVALAPSPAESVKPTRPPRSRSDVPAEVRALYPPLFELTKSPRKGDAAMGVYTKAGDLWREFGATPEQVAMFWDWFKVFSRAAQMAARERRPLNPPKPKQVYEAWPLFLPWWQAKQEAAARADEARRRAEEEAAATVAPPAGDAPRLSGRELYRRTFGLPRPATPPTAD